MDKKNVGIIVRFCWGSYLRSLKDSHNLFTYDISKNCNCESIDELVNKSEFIFVCVPTPMNKIGQCDLSIVE